MNTLFLLVLFAVAVYFSVLFGRALEEVRTRRRLLEFACETEKLARESLVVAVEKQHNGDAQNMAFWEGRCEGIDEVVKRIHEVRKAT